MVIVVVADHARGLGRAKALDTGQDEMVNLEREIGGRKLCIVAVGTSLVHDCQWIRMQPRVLHVR